MRLVGYAEGEHGAVLVASASTAASTGGGVVAYGLDHEVERVAGSFGKARARPPNPR